MNRGGSIYLNGTRYWWKVRLPGCDKLSQIPLKSPGAQHATCDRKTAEIIADELWQKYIRTQSANTVYDGRLVTLIAMYHKRNLEHYLPPSRHAENIQYAIFPLAEYFPPDKTADDFNPLDLKKFRDFVVEGGKYDWSRGIINRRVNMIKQMFKWAASEMLVSVHAHSALATVEGLREGRTLAREGKKILPVPPESIEAVLSIVTPEIADMIRIQLFTGMRPGELVQIRPYDIDRDGEVWVYRPETHKTAFQGHQRSILIGPKAQKVLSPYLLRMPIEYCFRPADSDAQFREKKHEMRKTPLKYGNRPGTNNQGSREFNGRFNVGAYRKAITRACKRAKVTHWHPHQLRHTAATSIRREFGLDAARAVLGHKTLAMTDDYAELDQKKAEYVAKNIG